jgi:hypothetical protein
MSFHARADLFDMAGEEDWRLIHEEDWMHGAHLHFRRYKAPSEDWTHDHCELCRAKFSQNDQIDALREGYVSEIDSSTSILPVEERTTFLDGYRVVASPDTACWICPTCFEDFRERFGWSAKPAGIG